MKKITLLKTILLALCVAGLSQCGNNQEDTNKTFPALCISNTDCQSGYECINSECTPYDDPLACDTDDDCPSHCICSDNGRCGECVMPIITCLTDNQGYTQCGDTNFCQTDDDCKPDYECKVDNQGNGQCVYSNSCETDDDCSSNCICTEDGTCGHCVMVDIF